MAQAAGHDINYIALAGALAHFGREGGKPTPPINLVGDFGGGGMFMAFGVVCGILEAQRSGKGQVIDVAMVDGSAVLDDDDVGPRQDRVLGREAGRERARHRRAVLRHLRDRRRQVRLARFARTAVLRRAHREARPRRRRPAAADGPQRLGHAAHASSPSCSRPRRATSGTRSCAAPTPATRRCSRCRRRWRTRTSRRAARSSNATACRSRRRRRASRAPSPRCSGPRRGPASTPTRRSVDWGFAADEIAKLREVGAIA